MQMAKKVAPWDDPTGATDGAAVAAGITMYSAAVHHPDPAR
jgi:hypothetical protein